MIFFARFARKEEEMWFIFRTSKANAKDICLFCHVLLKYMTKKADTFGTRF
jgi:hypothetical protein